jgi:PAS domain S-box-containing protein
MNPRQVDDTARLAAIVAGADDAIVGKTLEGVITSWNRAAELMFGYTAAEAVGRNITLIVPPDRLHEERDILARLARGEAIHHFETERVARDGRRLQVSLTVSPIRDPQGRVIGASKIARDISRAKADEQKLRTTVATLEALYRLADEIGRAQDREGVCEAAVEAIVSGMRVDRASVLAFDHTAAMRFVASRNLSDAYRRAVDGHSPWSSDTRDAAPILVADLLTDDRMAGLRDVIAAEGIRALAFIPLLDQGQLLGKFMTYYDTPHDFSDDEVRLAVTIARHVAFGLRRVHAEATVRQLFERERGARQEADAARSQAERASQAKDEFLAMLSHELRNPLGVIVNAVSVMQAGAAAPEQDRKALDMIGRQGQHLAHLIDDLLDVARISSGRIELARETVDLRDAVRLALEAHRHQADGKDQQLEGEAPAEPLVVQGDPVRLQQVLGNLLNNATKYTPPGGRITVLVERDGEHGLLRVRDNGAGIPGERLEEVFDLFVQANPTLARTEGGLGIGLTLVKRVVELHGGTVKAFSAGPGRGAEFTVRLPLAPAAAVAAAPPPRAPAAGGRRVLVIEDHDDGREGLVMLLQLHGHDVLQAASGKEGIALACRERPQVALVDIGLPDVDGYEVARRLRGALGDQVTLVAVTGYGQPRDRTLAAEAGFDTHLVKPIDSGLLAAALALASPSPPEPAGPC